MKDSPAQLERLDSTERAADTQYNGLIDKARVLAVNPATYDQARGLVSQNGLADKYIEPAEEANDAAMEAEIECAAIDEQRRIADENRAANDAERAFNTLKQRPRFALAKRGFHLPSI